MTSRSSVVTVLMILAFGLAGYLLYTKVISQPPRETSEVVVCASPECHHVFLVHIRLGKGGAPYECEQCLQQTSSLAFQCQNPECRAIFPVTSEAMKSGEEIRCPVCGAQARQLLRIPEDADALAEKGIP